MNNKVIGIAGRKQSGKSVLSNILINDEYQYHRFTYDNELKNIICKLLSIDRNEMEILKNDSKNVDFKFNTTDIDYLANTTGIDKHLIEQETNNEVYLTVRDMLQLIGTNIIRKYNKNWHVNCVEKKIQELFEKDKNANVVIDDVRFKNEMTLIKNLGGEMFFIIKPDNWNVSNHESERSLTWDMMPNQTNIIINDCTIDALKSEWKSLIESDWKEKNTTFNVFNTEDKNYLGNKYAFHYDADYNELSAYVAGFLLSTNNNGEHNFLDKETGLINVITDNKFMIDCVSKVLGKQYDYLSGCDMYELSLYNPFIIENLKRWATY